MSKSTSPYPTLSADATGTGVVSHAGAVTLLRTAEVTGLTTALTESLSSWRKPLAQFDPGKIITDLAVSLTLGGDCLADIATLREHTAVFGKVPSDPTVSRLMAVLAADAPSVLTAIDTARASARAAAWGHAGERAPDHDITAQHPIVIDLDATLVAAHSEKESAAPTYKRGFGFHPLLAFVDHGIDGTGEPVAALLRPGNAGSNTADDHIAVTRKALAQLPNVHIARPGKKVLVRTVPRKREVPPGAGASHKYLTWLHNRGVLYSIGFGLTEAMVAALAGVPDGAWSVAVDAAEKVRDGAWVIDATGVLDLTTWPTGMRVIIRKERPHPGAQLRFADSDGLRLTAFVTNTVRGQVQDLELRHRRRAPLRRPYPLREGQRADQSPAAWIRPEPDLVSDRAARPGFDGVDSDARLHRPRSTQVGTETRSPTPVLDRRAHHEPCPPHPTEAVEDRAMVDPRRHRIDPARSATRARLTALHPTRRPRKNPHLRLWTERRRSTSAASSCTDELEAPSRPDQASTSPGRKIEASCPAVR